MIQNEGSAATPEVVEAARPGSPLVRSLEAVTGFLDTIALVLGACMVVAVGAMVVADVAGRSLFGHSISGTVELARNLVVLIVFCQVPASILEGKMLRVVALFSRFSGGVQTAIEVTAALIALGIFILLIVSAIEPMLSAFRSGEADGLGALKVPLGPVRAALVVLWGLAALSAFVVMVKCLSGQRPAIVVTE